MKIKFVCNYCGGDNVTKDAWASWDVKAQEWVLHSTYDDVFCHDCEGSTSIEAVDLEETQNENA